MCQPSEWFCTIVDFALLARNLVVILDLHKGSADIATGGSACVCLHTRPQLLCSQHSHEGIACDTSACHVQLASVA